MAYDLGTITISINAHIAGLSKGLSQASAQVKNLGTTMTKAGKDMKKGAQAGITGLLSLQSFVKKIVHYITFTIGVQMVMSIVRGIQASIEIFREFEKSVVNAAAVSGYLGKSFDMAKEKIAALSHELSSKTIFLTTEVAESMYNLASAGIDPVTKSAEDLLPILQYAQANQRDLAAATKDVLVVVKQFNLEIEDSSEIVDTWTALISTSFQTAEKMADGFRYVGQIAGELNQDFRMTSAALTALVNSGYEGAQAGQRLNMIFTKLINPTDKSRKLLAEMGVSVSDLDPSIHSLVDILYTLRAAEFDVSVASQMFRARTAAAAATLVSSVEEVEEYILVTKQLGGITEFVAEKQMDTLEGRLKAIEDAAQKTGIALVDYFGTGIMQAADLIGDLIDMTGEIGDDLGIDLGGLTSFNWGFITDMLGMYQTLKEFRNEAKAWVDTIAEMPDELDESSKALTRYRDISLDVMGVNTRMRKLEEEGLTNSEEYMNLQLQLVTAERQLATAESDVIKETGDIISMMQNSNTQIGEGISLYKNLFAAEGEVATLELRRNSLLDKQTDLEDELNQIRTTRGVDSEEYAQTLGRIASTEQMLEGTITDLADATTKAEEAEDSYNTMLNEVDANTRHHIESMATLIQLRGELFEVTNEYNKAEREYKRLVDVSTNYTKYYEEAMQDLYDMEDKLYEIEYKRYALKEDEQDLLDDLFDQLAEEGLLTEEIIDSYSDWMQAEGDLAGAQAAYAAGDITEEELQVYIDAAKAAQDRYSDAVQETANHYIDIGIASNDVANSIMQLNQQQNDVNQLQYEYDQILAGIEAKYADIAALTVTPEDIDNAQQEMDDYETKLDDAYNKLLLFSAEYETEIILKTPDFTVEGQTAGEAFAGGFVGELYRIFKTGLQNIANVISGILGAVPIIGPSLAGGFRSIASGLIRALTPELQKGGFVNKETLATIGERGAEAVVPLEGANRKYGAAMMKKILPAYFPDIMGDPSAFRGGPVTNITNTTGPSEEFNINNVQVSHVGTVSSFMEQLKYRSRISSGR